MRACARCGHAVSKGYGDCERGSVTRKIREFVLSALALLVLSGMLLSISPRLRERATQMTSDREFDALSSTVTYAASSALGLLRGYAGDNTYLFTFLIAACVFVVLMLKVIS